MSANPNNPLRIGCRAALATSLRIGMQHGAFTGQHDSLDEPVDSDGLLVLRSEIVLAEAARQRSLAHGTVTKNHNLSGQTQRSSGSNERMSRGGGQVSSVRGDGNNQLTPEHRLCAFIIPAGWCKRRDRERGSCGESCCGVRAGC